MAVILCFAVLLPVELFAQAPVISYATPQTYTVGTAISPLVPSNTGGAIATSITLASGAFTPAALAVDTAGNVYFVDLVQGVKKIPAAGGPPVSVGSGFSQPIGVGVDEAGNVYVADKGTHAIYKLLAGGGVVTVASGLGGLTAMAVDPAGDLFISDGSNTFSIPGTVNFQCNGCKPTAMTADGQGNGYFLSGANNSNLYEMLNITAVIPLHNPLDIAADLQGNIFYTALNSNLIKEIPFGGGIPVSFSSDIANPHTITVDKKGNIYVGSSGPTSVIQKIYPGVYSVNKALPPGLILDKHTGIISGTPYLNVPATDYIITANTDKGSSSASLRLTVNLPAKPNISYTNLKGYAVGTAITPVIPSNTGGIVPVKAPVTIATGFDIISGMMVDSLDNLFISDMVNNEVKKIPAGGNSTSIVASGFYWPTGLAMDALGDIYINDFLNTAIKEIPADGGPVTTLLSGVRVEGFVLDASKNMYFIEQGKTTIKKIPAGGGNPVTIGTSTEPVGITADAAGNVYVADYIDKAIKKIPAGGGSISTISTFTDPIGSEPIPITTDVDGNVYYATKNAVWKISADGGAVVLFATGNYASVMAIDRFGNLFMNDGNSVIIINSGGYTIDKPLPAGLSFDKTTGVISGTPVALSPAKTYTITAYNAAGSSSATINIDKTGASVNLSALTLSSGTLSPVFDPLKTSYTATTTSEFITVTPVATDATATIKINGTDVQSGNASPNITLNPGINTVNIVVSSVGGTATKTYSITITKEASGYALLKMTLSTGSELTYVSTSSQVNYFSASVTPGTASLTLTPTASAPGATITVNGTPVTSGTASQSIAINTNPTIITAVLTAADGITKRTYAVSVYKNGSSDISLKQMTLSTGSTLTYASGANQVAYFYASVSPGTASLTLAPTATDPNATIKVDGTPVTSGTASQSIALTTNPTIISVQVTAQDGVTQRTYAVSVYKNGSSNAILSNLTLSTGSDLTFVSNANQVNTYSASVTPGTNTLGVIPTASDPGATITVNGSPVVSGSVSQLIAINANPTVIPVEVTAADGITKRTTLLFVYKNGSSDVSVSMTLSAGSMLTHVSGANHSSNFSATVAAGTTSTTLTAVPNTPGAVITVNGLPVTSGVPSQSIALNTDPTIITVQVTAQDGVTTRTYSISVTHAAGQVFNSIYEAVSVSNPIDKPQLTGEEINVHMGLSPNGDGINDFLLIDGIANYPDNKLTIINRAGQVVFEAKNYDNSTKVFDGHSTKNGKLQLPGTYFYALDYKINGIARHKTGYIVMKY
ncbi:gliding motility-associated-like protein [Mucilaginibacter gotjawali]|uniref:Gliding motility-associated-like protein n=2 Tax=Mucilaginibacter gotjawali TaxID=1550579 RepID=A0A839SBN7_9SPHI|nr:gliding motility-associated-like protein [Mucilaginibacter gotjawali]